jgi:hypothetical protein
MTQRLIALVRGLLYWLSPDDATLSGQVADLTRTVDITRTAYQETCDSLKAVRAVLTMTQAELAALKATQPQQSGPLWDRARALVQAQEAIDGRSGEAKRHQTLAQLAKEFPGVRALALSKLIDAAVEAL